MEKDFEFFKQSHVKNLQDYLEENFNLEMAVTGIIRDILNYVAAQGLNSEETLDLLCNLLYSTGIERAEIIEAVQ